MKLPHVVIVWSLSSVAMAGTTYFVDSEGGDDAANGQSERTAWKTLGRINHGEVGPGDAVLLKRGGLWRETLRPVSGRPGLPVRYSSYGSGRKPVIQRSMDFSRLDDWTQIGKDLWVTDGRRPIARDVGIVIFDHGRRWGVKTWRRDGWQIPNSDYWRRHVQLKEDLDYRYEPEEKRVVVRLRANPAALFRSVELALTEHGVDQDRAHDVVYDGLWVRYCGAHGFAGSSTARIVIRNCDISWIGGGLQMWRRQKDGRLWYPVRYGNGIEFWCDCRDNLVENNRVWEIYDAALTNQGRKSDQQNIVWRSNLVWHAEYSFEHWNEGRTKDVSFMHNMCVDAGEGWGHGQRATPNGAHLMYYHNSADASGVVVASNCFVNATEWTMRAGTDWRRGLRQDGNVIWNEKTVPVCRWLDGPSLRFLDWDGYQALGFDGHGEWRMPAACLRIKKEFQAIERQEDR